EFIDADPGVQIVTSHVWTPGETLEFGPPVFDFHLVFNIPGGGFGETFAIHFQVHDLSGIYTDSDLATVLFTPVANTCLCRGDLDADHAPTGLDLQPFIECLLNSPGGPIEAACSCADMDADGAMDGADIDLFVARLLDGTACQ